MTRSDTSRCSVLLVEDDTPVRNTIATVLSLNGYEVETAINGFDALDKLRHKVPDLVFTDLHMPQMSGFELLSVVRRRFPMVKAIASSGAYGESGVPTGVLADDFYPKGQASARELLETISRVCRRGTPKRDRNHEPAWIPRNGTDASGKPFVVLSCNECLRAFPLNVAGAPTGEVESTPCIYCPNEIFYIIDFSRSTESPAKRVEWKRTFLQTQQGRMKEQAKVNLEIIERVTKEMNQPRTTASSHPSEPGLSE
jgi:CheY-like chemotaxis protein